MMQNQRFEDPKITFTIKIINEQEIIADLLNQGKLGTAAKRIATLLLRLNIPTDEKEVTELKNNLNPTNYHLYSHEQIFASFITLNEFLNRTYFSDFHKAKPRFGSEGKL